MDIRNWLDDLTNIATLIALPLVIYFYYRLLNKIKQLKEKMKDV